MKLNVINILLCSSMSYILWSNLAVKYTYYILAELSRKCRRSSTRSSDDIELSRKRRRSSTRSSDDPALQQSVAKKSLPDSMSIKMDLLA